MTDSIVLNRQQQEALNDLVAFCDPDNTEWAARVSGYAGTGKTTTIQRLLPLIPGNTVFTAPTHKAVKVMAAMARRSGLDVSAKTIHSLLGLKVREDEDRQKIEQDLRGAGATALSQVDTVVVDECSMISAELFDYIKRAARTHDFKVIFLGDPAQLPPVGEESSQTFTVPGSTLTEVMRQRGENPILGFCTDLREAWAQGAGVLPVVRPECSEDGSVGLHIMSGAYFREYMPSAFSHDQFDGNPDRFRVVAWTNDAVREYNGYIQRLRYPGLAAPFAEGEPVTFSAACKNRATAGSEETSWWSGELEDIAVTTEMEGTVLDVTPKPDGHPQYPGLIGCWQVSVRLENEVTVSVWTLDRYGQMAQEALLNQLARKARAKECTWFEFWQCKGAFASLRPAYAMTAHKSQGSTFENVFVDVQNIWRNGNKAEALQCLYVACSRASHHLIVNASG